MGDSPRATGHWTFRASMEGLPSTDELMTLARARALDPTVLDENPPIFGRATISNNLLDSYMTKMCPATHNGTPCTLQNYAADAEEGRSVLLGHDYRSAPLGKSLSGEFTGSGGNGVAKTRSNFYIVPGIAINGSDDVIRLARAGALTDVSVGFTGGRMACSICERVYWSWDCSHIAGLSYYKDANGDWALDREQNQDDAQQAFVWIHDARLSEYSLVFDGATPEAELTALKASQEAEGGRMTTPMLAQLRQRYHIVLPGTEKQYPGYTLAKEAHMPEPRKPATDPQPPADPTPADPTPDPRQQPPQEDEQTRAIVGQMTSIRELLAKYGASDPDPLVAVRALVDEVTALKPLAEQGRAWRVRVIDDAIKAGIRANGEKFKEDDWRATLGALTIEQIELHRDGWSENARRLFPGGRQTSDDSGEESGTRANGYPDFAYQA